ncbi:MAG: LacI family DNA-binding transcriptional regulator [Pseudomonadota bacterium]
MAATINDVALHAGVSMKTVSRVINNEPTVKKATLEKVQAAMKALNYQPNLAARNLAGTRSYTIGFVYDNPNAYYVIDMQNGMLAECRRQGYELLIHPCSHRSPDIGAELLAMVNQTRVAGLLLTPPFSEMPELIKLLDAHDVKFVRIISGVERGKYASSCVFVDDHSAAHAITEHLIEQGHRRIGFLCGGMEHRSTLERLNGYKAALTDHQLKVDPRFVVDGEYSFDSGVEGAKKLLARKDKPTAIFASNDEMAAGALFAARQMGVAVPEQLSIVGFEDSPFSRQTWPQLTTAHQPNRMIAQQATAMLIGRIRQHSTEETKEGVTSRSFIPELLVRGSSAKAPPL